MVGKISEIYKQYKGNLLDPIKSVEGYYIKIKPENFPAISSMGRVGVEIACSIGQNLISTVSAMQLSSNSRLTAQSLRPSCPSVQMIYKNGNHILAEVPDGFLDIIIDATNGGPSGTTMFNQMWAGLSRCVTKGIRGTWVSGKTHTDNFKEFKDAKHRGLTDVEAAKSTWTSRRAAERDIKSAKRKSIPRGLYIFRLNY